MESPQRAPPEGASCVLQCPPEGASCVLQCFLLVYMMDPLRDAFMTTLRVTVGSVHPAGSPPHYGPSVLR